MFAVDRRSHRRYNPLTDEWVIVAANRINRPWHGDQEIGATASGKNLNPLKVTNSLAPLGIRANGQITPDYASTFVLDNDFPSLTEQEEPVQADQDPSRTESKLFVKSSIYGICRVICYHPDSELTMAEMSLPDILRVIDTWIEQISELEKSYEWIQIFENKGSMVGCSNPHPHGQLWASNFLPTIPARKYGTQKDYKTKNNRPLLMDVVRHEMECRERIVCENDDWLVIVPFWAVWPFETMLLPKWNVAALNELNGVQKQSLAAIIQSLLAKYDNLFKCSFPYSMGWMGAPTGKYSSEDRSFWTLHAVYLPPLLRSAQVKKFMAGYELVCEPQRDITPEKVESSKHQHTAKIGNDYHDDLPIIA